MALDQRNEDLAADWVRFRELTTTGRSEQALRLAEQMIAESGDPSQLAQALLIQLAVHHAAKNQDALLPLLTKAEEQLRVAPHPRLVAVYHVFAAGVAYDRHSYEVALRHAIEADRALQRTDELTRAAVDAWHALAAAYTVLGYHARALEAADRCQSLCADARLPPALGVEFYARANWAAYLDQHGDSAGCVRELASLIERSHPLLADLPVINRVMLAYAVNRLAALDHPIALDVPAPRDVDPNLTQINNLGDVCAALAARLPDRALALLDATTESVHPFGIAEPLRLRALALAQIGDDAGARAAERAVLLVSSQEERELRRLLADTAGARIDQDQLRQSAERHARAALTDPLTGLPNRRKVDEFTTELTSASQPAVLGMLDLDGFKAINDNHGHPTGDLVLQRVAGILTREVRQNDLVARPGGDEFVLVLPEMTRTDAEALGERIEAAVHNEDWQSVVPNTPVAISIGWAELDADVSTAFSAADNALYETKRKHHTRDQV
jgi:diguanylate cyclase (GGDEF)-like protein